jgi:hypothetical protein
MAQILGQPGGFQVNPPGRPSAPVRAAREAARRRLPTVQSLTAGPQFGPAVLESALQGA